MLHRSERHLTTSFQYLQCHFFCLLPAVKSYLITMHTKIAHYLSIKQLLNLDMMLQSEYCGWKSSMLEQCMLKYFIRIKNNNYAHSVYLQFAPCLMSVKCRSSPLICYSCVRNTNKLTCTASYIFAFKFNDE